MAPFPRFFSEMNSCEYLFLREISEPSDNALRLMIEEARAASVTVSHEIGGILFSDLRPIESSNADRLFELTWNSYIAYSIRNESFVSMDNSEVVEAGRLIRVYSKSNFLDYVSKSTFATVEYPGQFRHWGIICENHIVDIVSTVEPEVRELRATQHRPIQDQIH